MSTSQDFLDFTVDQIDPSWNIRSKKMFGEYMVYINDKPLLLVCDNTVYVKKLDCLKDLIPEDSLGFPYKGAKEHFILDMEDKDLVQKVVVELEKVIPVPVKKSKPKNQ